MMTKLIVALASTAIAVANAKIYFQEDFNTADWNTRWIQSEWKPSNEVGAFKQITGKYWKDENDKALQTSEDARFYALTAKFNEIFDNKNNDLFLSYLVQHEQKLDCGGAYIKLLPSTTDLKKFGGDSPYNIMFGPDICGSTRKTHAILNYARPGKESINMDHQTEIRAESDSEPHLYSFIIRKDNTYDVKVDGKSIKSGQLTENWPFQPEKEIKDPSKSKPKDWVDDKMMPDPEDIKPANWDDIPKTIPDPEAKKPEDWDDEDDGEWEPAMIDNPEYKGEWHPKLIDNPDYKGPWEHPLIPNPEYFEDEEVYHIAPSVGAIGFELWQVKSGTLFDDILLTNEEEVFTTHEKTIMNKIKKIKENKDEMETLERQKEEAEAKKKEEEEAKDGEKDDEEEAVVEDEKDEDEKVDEKDEL